MTQRLSAAVSPGIGREEIVTLPPPVPLAATGAGGGGASVAAPVSENVTGMTMIVVTGAPFTLPGSKRTLPTIVSAVAASVAGPSTAFGKRNRPSRPICACTRTVVGDGNPVT